MKISSVQNTFINNGAKKPVAVRLRNNTENNKNVSSPSFKGAMGVQSLVDLWAAVARGGFAASFTMQDMLGTNFPRTFAALERNKDITGENNYKAALEVMIREFTTGPSMFVVPSLVLAAACRTTGSSNKVPTDAISDLSNIMKGTISSFPDIAKDILKGRNYSDLDPKEALAVANKLKEAFYKDTFAHIFGNFKDAKGFKDSASGMLLRQSGGRSTVDDIAFEYTRLMLNAQNAPKRSLFQSIFDKPFKRFGSYPEEAKDQILSKIKNLFSVDKKLNFDTVEDSLMAGFKPSVNNAKGRSYNISKLLDYMENYSNDFIKQYMKAQKNGVQVDGKIVKMAPAQFVERFKNLRIGTKALTNILMIVATGLFMFYIPKLYTRNKTNPETDAIYEQVNQTRKGAVNANK